MITVNDFCKKEYGKKLYKISFNAGFTCPNRDGSLSTKGCIFCSQGGSGDFAVRISEKEIVARDDGTYEYSPEFEESFAKAKAKVAKKYKGNEYIAYFQAYTNTYGDIDRLRDIYLPIVKRDDVAVLSIATRPDCISEEVYSLLEELAAIKPVWVELGLQTTKEKSVQLINRSYENDVYDRAVKRLNSIGVHTITHVILYLPGEDRKDMLNTVKHAVKAGTKGIKLQLLHILKNTALADMYRDNPFYIPSLEEYAEIVKSCLEVIPEEVILHRITGDAPKKLLIEPKWSADKKTVINTVMDTVNPPEPYYVYMLGCGDGSYYTGSTNDVSKRFAKHSSGKGCKYTASHQPVELIYVEECRGKRAALTREYQIKQLSKVQKKELISSEINIVDALKS